MKYWVVVAFMLVLAGRMDAGKHADCMIVPKYKHTIFRNLQPPGHGELTCNSPVAVFEVDKPDTLIWICQQAQQGVVRP